MKIRKGLVGSKGHHIAYLAVNEHLVCDERPAIVFIHGVLASVNYWRECVPPAFRKDRAWYSLSLPAHHPSTVPTDFAPEHVNEQWFYDVMYGALKELLGDRKAIIVGHSTGGFSALNLAIHQAPNVVGIVSIAGFHSGNWGGVEGLLVKLAGLGRWAESLFAFNIRLASKSRLIQRVFASLLAYNRHAYRANPISRRMLETIRPDVRAQNPAALFPLFNGISRLEIAEQLCHINVPCYLFAGTHDPVVPARQSLFLAGNIERAKTIIFRNVGHMPVMEDAEAYMAALERALDDIEAHDRAIRLRSAEPYKKGTLHHELN
ncbi:alpha/beta fold hydrolase [Marinobacter nauticus]|uniref:alpha/beta fold hydrolase n=1 Tax=Marinobacter nauticus TaxID=2743 RepID=UPI001C97379B|nr:alpha/beta hydrolase [Marinobacter nauticus]MBY6104831.1 alpha/beta hydrolase [Marinobacter nauticus]